MGGRVVQMAAPSVYHPFQGGFQFFDVQGSRCARALAKGLDRSAVQARFWATACEDTSLIGNLTFQLGNDRHLLQGHAALSHAQKIAKINDTEGLRDHKEGSSTKKRPVDE
jgi:hypothetical protein